MNYEAIVAIVERGRANAIVDKAQKAGARGSTIAFGRGTGERLFSFFRSLQVEPSKEIILIITPRDKTVEIFEVVVDAAQVREVGKGIAFTVPIGNLVGLTNWNEEPPMAPGAENPD